MIDEISELVYVVDIDNYDLLYINKSGKSIFQINDFKKRKCYDVIHGKEKPCDFCPNAFLNEKSFYVWESFNFVTKRHYILKDKLIPWNGKMTKMEIALDITEQTEQRLVLQKTLEIEKLILDCVKILHQTDKLDDAIQCILEKIGLFLLGDRVYIYQFNNDLMSNTYEWCAEKIEHHIVRYQDIPSDVISQWIKYFEKNECIYIENKEQIKETLPKIYHNLKEQKIERMIMAPLNLKGKLIGFIGVDNLEMKMQTQIESVLKPLAYFLVSSIDKMSTEAMLEKYSFFDVLTGLFNRNRFIRDLDKFDSALRQSVGVVYLDLNGLKSINDKLGHSYGDSVLVFAAKIIQTVFQEENIYRIGGDEYVVLCRGIEKEEFEKRVQELKNLFLINRECSASIGSKWSEDDRNIHQIVSQADELMYEDKKKYYRSNPLSRRYRYNVDDALGLANEEAILEAIENHRFLVYFQPKVRFLDRQLIGAEALVRYWSLDGMVEGPDHFIPALEETRLIHHVDFFVFDCVCRLIQIWLQKGYEVVPIAVNFSRYTLLEKDYIKKLNEIWEKYQIPRSLIEIEITESVENIDGSSMIEIISQIKEAGFSIAIDDFGVKYANLALLNSIEIDTLKLDKSLVDYLESNNKSCILIQSLAQICKNMQIHFIVEGVETEKQFEILRGLGCYGAQGYLFSRPIPLNEYESWLLKSNLK